MELFDNIEALEALPVKIQYIGEVASKWDGDKARPVDQWIVTLSNKYGSHSFDYFTGLGLRKEVKGARALYIKTAKIVGNRWVTAEPVKPKVADVLHSLILEASAADENFVDWCANYGYSDDSIKAMNMYKACLDTATALRKYFAPDVLRQIRELLQDY